MWYSLQARHAASIARNLADRTAGHHTIRGQIAVDGRATGPARAAVEKYRRLRARRADPLVVDVMAVPDIENAGAVGLDGRVHGPKVVHENMPARLRRP